jgi:hypothetical protein
MTTYGTLRRALARLGFAFFDDGDYNLNLVGLRTDDLRSELFNDWLLVAYRQNGHEQLWGFPMTTDPGTYWRQHPMNVKGTAILAPGQYPGCWTIGRHQDRYPALVQSGTMIVYRDNNLDTVLDVDSPRDPGLHGINLHRAGRLTDARSPVGKWSAGCQVIPDTEDFALLMSLIERAAAAWGPRFTYTLLTERQLWGHNPHGL